jgi:hypothetical protein
MRGHCLLDLGADESVTHFAESPFIGPAIQRGAGNSTQHIPRLVAGDQQGFPQFAAYCIISSHIELNMRWRRVGKRSRKK